MRSGATNRISPLRTWPSWSASKPVPPSNSSCTRSAVESAPSLYAGWLPAGEYWTARSFPFARKYTVTVGRLPAGYWCSMTAMPPLETSKRTAMGGPESGSSICPDQSPASDTIRS
jgi:hypothetical protein